MYGIKTKIGAGATLAALGGLAAYAVSSGDQPAAAPAATTQPVQVRTETIRRTIRVVKHEKPHRRRQKSHATPAAAPAPRQVAAAPAPRSVVAAAPPTPVAQAPTRAVSAPAPAPSHHVTTRSSGSSGSGGGEREHESEHEGGGGDD